MHVIHACVWACLLCRRAAHNSPVTAAAMRERNDVLRRQVEVALEFARAMAYMHSRSPALIHRDLKPANIMIGGSSFMLSDTALLLNSSGIVKVADFGLSKSLPKRGKTSVPGPAAGAAGVASVGEGMAALNRDTYRLTGTPPSLFDPPP